MVEHVIETKALTKRFGEVLAVDRLNMRVRKGEIYGFLGPNGAGKTTTMKMLLGLVHPTDGKAYVFGREVTPDGVEIRKRVGYLPERVTFYENLTARQTLEFFCDLKGEDRGVVPRLLEDVGLKDEADRKVGTFSKGMLQLLGFAQAMIGDPSLYILDEPSSGLDPRWVKVVRERIVEINRRGATVIFSSHILSEVQALCHRVGVINHGRMVAEDTIENLSRKLDVKPKLWVRLSGKAPRWVRGLKGADKVEVSGREVTFTCDTERRFEILAELKRRGLEIEDFRTEEPSLEEAFVKLLR